MSFPVPTHVKALLDKLHAESLSQEGILKTEGMGTVDFDTYMKDKYIALEREKCEYVYFLARAMGAKNIVEAGTSYGVSTIYLALAVSHNTAGTGGRVFATENEPTKADVARSNWKEAGADVESVIELREGDLRETLKVDLPEIDLLLLDIWAPLALATLKAVLPRLRKGAAVITDNITGAADRYANLIAFLQDEKNGFVNTVLPYHNGLGMAVYDPKR